MFLSLCSPRSSNVRSSLPAASSCTRADTQTPPWVGLTFKTSGDVHAFTEDVPVFDHDIAHVDADPEFDGVVRCASITVAHAALPLGRTTQCIHHTGKFDQQAITGRFDDAAPVFGDFRINHLGPDRL